MRLLAERPTTFTPPKKTRIHWNEEEQLNICKYVLEHSECLGIQLSYATSLFEAVKIFEEIPAKKKREVVQLAAFRLLPPHKQRDLSEVSLTKLPWLHDITSQLLQERWGAGGEEAPYVPPEEFVVAPPAPDPLFQMVRRQTKLIQRLRQEVEALSELVMEQLAKNYLLRSPPQLIQYELPASSDVEKPVIAVAGVRRHQHSILQNRLKDLAVIEFVDATKRSPESLADFDRVFVLRCTSRKWMRSVHHVVGEKFTEVHGTSTIVKIVEEMVGVSEG